MNTESGTPALQSSRVVTGEYEGPEGRRPWRLFVPGGDATAPRAMLVMLHGCTQDAADIARGTRFDEEAEAGNFLVLYPEQTVADEHLVGPIPRGLHRHPEGRDAVGPRTGCQRVGHP